MIIVTGAAGFIGSNLISKLNKENFNNIIAVDLNSALSECDYLKNQNINKTITEIQLPNFIQKNSEEIEYIFHLGAITNTLETDESLLYKYNTHYSIDLWNQCCNYQIPLIYASSAATYGDGSLGFSDDESNIKNLNPLNAYAQSKQTFDEFVIDALKKPFFWAGLKFFNVYGPNESHKGKMASMVHQSLTQLQQTSSIKLFKSDNEDFQHGYQLRDFIYIEDLVDVLIWFMQHRKKSGIYNVGSGSPDSFLNLANNVIKYSGINGSVSFCDMPTNLKARYQYKTVADISKLRRAGYEKSFTPLELGVKDFIKDYLN